MFDIIVALFYVLCIVAFLFIIGVIIIGFIVILNISIRYIKEDIYG